MGQRHQIFIKTHNPVRSSKKYSFYGEDKQRAIKIFGKGKYTVIALHHQWLYGMSAVVTIKNILDVTNPENISESNPFHKECYTHIGLDGYINSIMIMVQAQFNLLHPRGVGVEAMHFLNSECLDENGKYNERWDMRKHFFIGDNNDGITIIDAVERKYCMMNIYEQNTEYENGVHILPSETPVSALEYVNAYYPKEDDKPDNEELIKKLGLDMIPLLTIKELQKIAPKTFKKDLEVSK